MVISIIAILLAFGQLTWESIAAGVTKCHEVEYDTINVNRIYNWNISRYIGNRCDEVCLYDVQIYEKKNDIALYQLHHSFMTVWCVVDYNMFEVTPESRYYAWLD